MTNRRIVLVEETWYGHHPTFFAHFILALEELGSVVLALCPHPEEARQMVATLRERLGVVPSQPAQTVYQELVLPRKLFTKQPFIRLGEIIWTVEYYRALERSARKWQADSGKAPDLIFYACIYDHNFKWFGLVQRLLTLPWAGLYMHATTLPGPTQVSPKGRVIRAQKFFTKPLCRGLALFDEEMVAEFSAATGKPVVAFPDLTDGRLPTELRGRALEIRLKRFAEGRPVIGLFGFLLASKGLLPLALISQHPKMSEACFAFGGELLLGTLAPQDAKIFSDILTNGANIWTHLMRIPDEEQMNSMISACDIIYAAYLNFTSSSNLMVKAALLRKPMIVSEGHLMAARVRRFRMGEVVPQGDVEAQVEAILRIAKNPGEWIAENKPRWDDYAREHSFARLKESFQELLSKV